MERTKKLPPAPPAFVPFGRIADVLRTRPDANLIAVRPGHGACDDYRVKRYNSRAALETFLTRPGSWYALVKTPTPSNMLLYPSFQRAES